MYNNDFRTNSNLNNFFDAIGRGIVGFDPAKGFNYIADSFSDVFNGMSNAFKNTNNFITSRLDILENDNIYEVIIELAGINKENVKIVAKEDALLEIKAIRKKPELSDMKFVHQERNFDDILRTLRFPKVKFKNLISFSKCYHPNILILLTLISMVCFNL